MPPPDDEQPPVGAAGFVPNPFTYHLSQAPEEQLSGGSVKVFDTRNFPAATTIVGQLVTVEPGAMRELHVSPIILRLSSLIMSIVDKKAADITMRGSTLAEEDLGGDRYAARLWLLAEAALMVSW